MIYFTLNNYQRLTLFPLRKKCAVVNLIAVNNDSDSSLDWPLISAGIHTGNIFHLCNAIQTLVEYGSNVTIQNQQGERPSQSAERQGHTTCARYLVVVETCMSLASQVVKLTKQLNE